jgi:hypothetical protein
VVASRAGGAAGTSAAVVESGKAAGARCREESARLGWAESWWWWPLAWAEGLSWFFRGGDRIEEGCRSEVPGGVRSLVSPCF